MLWLTKTEDSEGWSTSGQSIRVVHGLGINVLLSECLGLSR